MTILNKQHIIIFGAGISSATAAYIFAQHGYQVTIYETRNHIGGNVYVYSSEKIMVQKYGPHIFHTDKKQIYDFVCKFCKLNKFNLTVIASINDKLVPLPINFQSLKTLFPKRANIIQQKLKQAFNGQPTVTISELLNSKDEDIQLFAQFIYKNVYENYSSKMWGIPIAQIDPNTLARVRINLSYQNNYFPLDKYQGIPVGGFTKMVSKMLKHKNIKVILNSKVKLTLKNNQTYINNKLSKDIIFYCGSIDELCNYKFGKLPYRSLHIELETIKTTNYQSSSVINYPAHPTMTRIAEYKKLYLQNIKNRTIISKEFPGEFNLKSKKFNQRYYPINNPANNARLQKYLDYTKSYRNLNFLGRLAQYKYFDMDDAIENAMQIANKFLSL
jgi:UDP-galactopyranose mutase